MRTHKHIFLDNCILSLSDTLQGASLKQEINWGGERHTVDIAGYMRKPLPSEDQAWKREQILCLPTIGKMAKEEKFKLYKYIEVDFEGWKRPLSLNLGNVFKDVEIQHVEAAVERSYFFQSDTKEHLSNERIIEFCKWLRGPNIEALAEKLKGNERYPDFLLENMEKVQRYREICKGLSDKQLPDAFHLWTAEVNGADMFLTTDKKFIRVMTETKNIELPCYPISPTDLLKEMNIEKRETMEYPSGKFIDFFGNVNDTHLTKNSTWTKIRHWLSQYARRIFAC